MQEDLKKEQASPFYIKGIFQESLIPFKIGTIKKPQAAARDEVESADLVGLWYNTSIQIGVQANETVASYAPEFGHISLHGWNLESYVFYKLKSGDYKVSVTSGDRTTGGSRDFFITPYCFEAKTYEKFLDRYLKIVPAYSFGLGKKEILPNEEPKKILGY